MAGRAWFNVANAIDFIGWLTMLGIPDGLLVSRLLAFREASDLPATK
jgi:hypothetical protein